MQPISAANRFLTFPFFFLLLATACRPYQASDAGVSRSLAEAREAGLLIAGYRAENPGPGILVEEAWLEPVWFWTETAQGLEKKPRTFCQFCFRLRQGPDLPYRKDNYGSWRMKEEVSGRSVSLLTMQEGGVRDTVYVLSLKSCSPPDSLVLLHGSGDAGPGRLVFRKE